MTAKKHTAAAEAQKPAEAPATPPVQPAAPATAAAYSFKFALEDNVPLPSKRVGPKGDTAYPYAVMGINQSFFVPSTEKMKEPWKTLTSMSSRISRELHPKQFTTARMTAIIDGKEVEGVRVWRKPDTTEPLKPPKVLNRKPRGSSAAALAAEAVAGDTSQRQHPAPDFDTPPPPPAPAAPPPPPAA